MSEEKKIRGDSTFEEWWHDHGSGIVPLPDHDLEAHTKRVAALAFAAARISLNN